MTVRYLTRREVAARLRVHVNTVDRMAVLGTGPKRVTYGRIVRYAEHDVDNWVAQHTT